MNGNMSECILFWHRNDLRVSDNMGLAAAREQSQKVVGVFCLDPQILALDDVAPARVTYMIGCLQELQESYRQAGSQLLILQGKPEREIPSLASAIAAQTVFWNWDVEPYAKQRDRRVTEALQEKGIAIQNQWDRLLHAPGEVLTKSDNTPYTVYTPFWKNWVDRPKAEPAATLEKAEGLNEQQQQAAEQAGAIALPTAKDLGYVWENELLLDPGETAAFARLEAFCKDGIREYDEQRNFPAIAGTSCLSAANKFGAIGIRSAWHTAQNAYDRVSSDEIRDNIRAWQQEIAWREFYQHGMYFFPHLAENPYREQFKDFPWEDNEKHFQAWCEGKTGYPMVDAAMRQLNTIGWMHNRCRMIVANFLTKDLIIHWQRGEKYFMQKLFDGDLSANNGGWQWSASCGLDPKPLRIFNPSTQAEKYDPEAQYIRRWLPELSSVDTADLVSGKIANDQRDRCGYPHPIVDHKEQQREFKRRYKEIK